jgi:toxin YoeB
MKNIVFDPKAFKQFNEWAIEDKKLYKKIVDLIDDILRHPFSGIGKPVVSSPPPNINAAP